MSQQKTKFIENQAVTNSKLANVSTATIKGRSTGGTGSPEDLTGTQATALLVNFVGDSGSGGTKGLVPAPAAGDTAANKFLKADGSWDTLDNINETAKFREDFLGRGIANTSFATTGTGTGNTFILSNSLISSNRWGIVAGSTGTTTTGRGSGGGGALELGASTVIFEATIYLVSLSTVTEEYIFDIGLHDQVTTSNAMTTGFSFHYDRLTSTNWIVKTANASTTTSTTTSVAVAAATWFKFKAVQISATSVEFFINNTSVATHTTNISTGSTVNPAIRIIKSAGTTSVSAHCDYIDYQATFNTAR